MEKFKKLNGMLTVMFALLSILVFVGCQDATIHTIEASNAARTGVKTVTLIATSEGGMLTFKSDVVSRTILPAQITGDNYNYFLIYQGENDAAKTVKQITFKASTEDSTKGTFKQEFTIDSYDMILYACPKTKSDGLASALDGTSAEADIKGEAVLSCYTHVDLRYVNQLAFYLTANNLEGNGNYSVTIESATDFVVPSTDYDITAGIYGADDDLLKSPTTAQAITTAAVATKFDAGQVLAGGPLAAGSYNLKVTFTPKAGTTGKKTHTYSERIIIAVNRTSTGTVTVPDIFDRPPTAPISFIAGYIEPASSKQNVYTAEFAWTDTSYREDGFEIDLMKVDGTDYITALPIDDTTWSALKTTYCTDTTKVFDDAYYKTAGNDINAGCSAWAESLDNVQLLTLTKTNLSAFRDSLADGGSTNADNGSLNMNSTHVKLLLPLEHRFVARIRAVNEAGESSYAYLTLPQIAAGGSNLSTAAATKGTAGAEKSTDAYDLATTVKDFKANVTSVNLYRLTYEKCSGDFYDITSTVANPAIALVSYKSQRDTDANGVAIMVPNARRADAAVTPNIDAVGGSDNTIEMTGLATDNIKLELRRGINFWQKWRCGADNGEEYPMTSDGSYDIPNLYKDYKNLTLFADYTATATLDGSITAEDITLFELKPDFIAVQMKDTTATPANFTPAATNNTEMANGVLSLTKNPQIVSLTEVGAIEFTLDATKAVYTKKDSSNANINYDTFNIEVTQVAGGDTVYKNSTDDLSNALSVSLKGRTKGKYAIRMFATKGKYTFELSPNLILEIVQ